jgi:hypothetical protein
MQLKKKMGVLKRNGFSRHFNGVMFQEIKHLILAYSLFPPVKYIHLFNPRVGVNSVGRVYDQILMSKYCIVTFSSLKSTKL